MCIRSLFGPSKAKGKGRENRAPLDPLRLGLPPSSFSMFGAPASRRAGAPQPIKAGVFRGTGPASRR